MRRADRLFQIVQYLRARRLTTARQLSTWLKVSERTIYRDVQDLSLSGVPVEGEAGVGYRLNRNFDIPPVMFTLALPAAPREDVERARMFAPHLNLQPEQNAPTRPRDTNVDRVAPLFPETSSTLPRSRNRTSQLFLG